MTEISEDTVRADARAWLEANWNPDYGLVEWRLKLAESGWGVPHWPSRWYGRDLPIGLVPVVEEEFKRIGAIGVAKRCQPVEFRTHVSPKPLVPFDPPNRTSWAMALS